jgi:transcription initiation factor IIF auxiliary subunit
MIVDDLKRINKEVIMFMNADIKKSIFSSKLPEQPISPKINHSPPFLETTRIQKEYDTLPPFDVQSRLALYDRPIQQPVPVPVSVTDIQKSQYETLKSTYDIKKEKEDKMEQAKKDFDNFQSKYTMGFERKPPPPIDFSIQMDNDRIKNMDELIQQQMAEREKDLQGLPLANIQ